MKSLQILADVAPIPEDVAFLCVHQATEGPEEAGLTRPVRSGDLEALALAHREADALKHMPIASQEMEILGLQPPSPQGSSRRFRGNVVTHGNPRLAAFPRKRHYP